MELEKSSNVARMIKARTQIIYILYVLTLFNVFLQLVFFLSTSSNFTRNVESEIKQSRRDQPPAHYILKINSFSELSEILSKTRNGKYEFDEFEAGDYKWKLVLYPNGNEKKNGKGHISLYLASTDENVTSSPTHVHVLFSFFVYDHIRDNYLIIQDGEIKRYHVLRTENGFDQLVPLSEFNDPSNGYVIDDRCVFGAEVYIIKSTSKPKAEEFSLVKNPPNGTFTWKIDEFSTIMEHKFSPEFSVAGRTWKLLLVNSKECLEEHCKVSLCLCHTANNSARQSDHYAEYNFLVKDQLNGIYREPNKASKWFGNHTSTGCSNPILLNDLHNSSKGFILNDSVIFEAKITLIAVSKDLIS
ncbi:TRAF-like family protein [Euphorbia peplus]|nr:TRAF-like family protein [Euphorbia peplus]